MVVNTLNAIVNTLNEREVDHNVDGERRRGRWRVTCEQVMGQAGRYGGRRVESQTSIDER